MNRALLFLLMTLGAAPCVQATDRGQTPWHNERFSPQHQQKKQKEQLAIASRVQQLQRISTDRNEAQYAENRRRCQAALQVAEQCGKFAGTFYCDDKGFKPVAADTAFQPAVMNNIARYRMERCALDASRRAPGSALPGHDEQDDPH